METPRILLVDDHPLVLEAIEARLGKSQQLQVVGTASSGEEALEKIGSVRPDLVLMDLRMPGMGGLEAIKRVKAQFPSVAVVVLTVSESKDHLLQAVLAGAAGYITKDSPPGMLVDALRAVLSGSTTIPTEFLRQTVLELRQQLRPAPADAAPLVQLSDPLTEREEEVLKLLAQGHSNRGIGEKLHIVEATVKKHVHNIIRKLGVSDRTQAVVTSIRMGLVTP